VIAVLEHVYDAFMRETKRSTLKIGASFAQVLTHSCGVCAVNKRDELKKRHVAQFPPLNSTSSAGVRCIVEINLALVQAVIKSNDKSVLRPLSYAILVCPVFALCRL